MARKPRELEIVRYVNKGEQLEIFVDPARYSTFKKGQTSDLCSVVANNTIYSNAASGKTASEQKVEKALGHVRREDRIRTILALGTKQQTAGEREEKHAGMWKAVIGKLENLLVLSAEKTQFSRRHIENAVRRLGCTVNAEKNVDKTAKELAHRIVSEQILPAEIRRVRIVASAPLGDVLSVLNVNRDIENRTNENPEDSGKTHLLVQETEIKEVKRALIEKKIAFKIEDIY